MTRPSLESALDLATNAHCWIESAKPHLDDELSDEPIVLTAQTCHNCDPVCYLDNLETFFDALTDVTGRITATVLTSTSDTVWDSLTTDFDQTPVTDPDVAVLALTVANIGASRILLHLLEETGQYATDLNNPVNESAAIVGLSQARASKLATPLAACLVQATLTHDKTLPLQTIQTLLDTQPNTTRLATRIPNAIVLTQLTQDTHAALTEVSTLFETDFNVDVAATEGLRQLAGLAFPPA